jgi:2-amino-4-hydroxy-6-hydroxymethyldihydropteridine diphosphokinase
MPGRSEVLILLGGNVGKPSDTLTTAEELLGQRAGELLARSRDHWTEPWGFQDDRLFLNRAILLASEMPPEDIMKRCLEIERELGRTRGPLPGYAARTIDVDILMVEGHTHQSAGLEVPHPRLHERAFALAPAADIAPHWRHPVLGRTVLQMLNDLQRQQR